MKVDKRAKTGGRQAGTPNKTTQDVRKAIALLAERNIGNLEKWLTDVATTDPAKAADLLLKAIEYHIPKLARSEVTDEDGKVLPIAHVAVSLDFNAVKNRAIAEAKR